MPRADHLHLVGDPGEPPPSTAATESDPGAGDLALTAAIFAVSLLPIAGAIGDLGRWGQGALGLATAGSLFAGRELWSCSRAALRAGWRPRAPSAGSRRPSSSGSSPRA